MFALTRIYANICDPLDRMAPFVLPTLARLTFFATLFWYYWNSAGTKVWDRRTDEGWVDFFTLESGVYAQMFPKAFEAAGYDASQLNFGYTIIAWLGTYGEWALPALIVLGLFTRIAALGMIAFVAVQTWVDVRGHGAEFGTVFDTGYGLADERLLWVFLLIVLVMRGGGPLSLDRGLSRAFGRYWERDGYAHGAA